MSDERTVSGTVRIDQTSKESVAFELMSKIAPYEKNEEKSRSYWLKLYSQCLMATNGYKVEDALK